MFCLPKNLTEQFRQKLKSGEINPEKLMGMSSQQRRDYFSSFLGDLNAEKVNTLFESKLLLKNQKKGIINWAKNVAGMQPEVLRDIVSRVEKMETVLNPATEEGFLADIAAHKLGVTVTMQEAAEISSLAKNVSENKSKIKEDSPIGSQERLEYGRARVKFDNRVNDLKVETGKEKLTAYLRPSNYGKAVSNLAGLAKSMKASLDNSVIGRQGLKVLFSHPGTWLKNSKQSFVDMWHTYGGREVIDEVRADVMSRPNALNGLYQKEGLAVGVKEEAYPTSLPAKIPILGKAFKASETAFTAFQYRTRADVFDKYVEIAEKSGGDTQGLGKIANALTGRGHLGAAEPVANVVNNIFFSPRLFKSNIDTLTAHFFDKNISPFAKKQAAINLLKITSGIAAILTIAKLVDKDSVETDPRSSDFGKIKVGDTRFDVSGGMSSIITVASRLATQSSKSSVTKTVAPLNSDKFGAATGTDVVYNFFENKLSPLASVLKDILKGKDFQGKKVSFSGEVNNLLTPIAITNYQELRDNPNSANVLVAMIADALGISTNTYSNQTDWAQNSGVVLKEFHDKVGDKIFKEANVKFNKEFRDWFDRAQNDKEYQSLSDEDKKNLITEQKNKIKKQIFRENGFFYRSPKKNTPKI